MGIGGRSEGEFVNRSRAIRFDVECPLNQCGIEENGTVKKKKQIEDMKNKIKKNMRMDGWRSKTHAVAICCPGHTLYMD